MPTVKDVNAGMQGALNTYNSGHAGTPPPRGVMDTPVREVVPKAIKSGVEAVKSGVKSGIEAVQKKRERARNVTPNELLDVASVANPVVGLAVKAGRGVSKLMEKK